MCLRSSAHCRNTFFNAFFDLIFGVCWMKFTIRYLSHHHQYIPDGLAVDPESTSIGVQLDSLEKSVRANAEKSVDLIPSFFST